MKNSGLKLAEFQKLIDHLKQDVAEKDSTLLSLRDRLGKMDIMMASANQKIDTLNMTVQNQGQQISNQTQVINTQTTALNTAYYILGTSKELKKDNIIKGGKLLPDFNKSVFTKVDIRNTKEIPLDSKSVKLDTNHPPSSFKYVIEGKTIKSLEVLNEQAFWSTSKYLVMEVNK